MIGSLDLQLNLKKRTYWQWRDWKIRYAIASPPAGDSPTPLLFLHGFGGSIEHWQYNTMALGRHRATYALDLLGFGESEKPPENYSIALWVEQAYDFWRTFLDRPVVLVGNSMGSAISLMLARTHPEMVRGVSLVGLPDLAALNWARPEWIESLSEPIEERVLRPLLQQTFAFLLRQPSVIRQWAKSLCANPMPFTEELVVSIIKPTQTPECFRAWSSVVLAMTRPNFMPELAEILPEIDRPVLWLSGRQDAVLPPKLDDRLFQKCSNLTRITLDNAGHYLHYERSSEVNQTIANWIESWEETGPFKLDSALNAA
ncbi:MAG: alpha/beta fold hydrolase [Cyanobacteriota bacterium]|nr:alpha/beta fold hydrolase [Cyanobacteriota bacterium]